MRCLVLRSNFALLLTIQFALLISSLINIISLLLTTFDWTKVRGIAPRSHTGRPRTCLVIISDPRRGCYIVLSMFIFSFFFFFFSFFSATLVRPISLQPLLAETPNSVCCLVLWSSFALLLTTQFALLFFFSFFFSAKILSEPYLWNCYSQRLQIECAAWSCGLVVHYCLPSNSLCYLFFFSLFFRHDFVRAISLEPLLAETPN